MGNGQWAGRQSQGPPSPFPARDQPGDPRHPAWLAVGWLAWLESERLGSCAHCGMSVLLRHQGVGPSGVEPTRRSRASARISRSSQETAGSGSRGTLFTYPEGTLKGRALLALLSTSRPIFLRPNPCRPCKPCCMLFARLPRMQNRNGQGSNATQGCRAAIAWSARAEAAEQAPCLPDWASTRTRFWTLTLGHLFYKSGRPLSH